MPTERVDYSNSRGQNLAALPEFPDRAPVATTLLARCFTCQKHNPAAKRIAEALPRSQSPRHPLPACCVCSDP
jgi:hypothetical protein